MMRERQGDDGDDDREDVVGMERRNRRRQCPPPQCCWRVQRGRTPRGLVGVERAPRRRRQARKSTTMMSMEGTMEGRRDEREAR